MANAVRSAEALIYFIECEATGRIKIGKTRSLATRLQTLQTGASDRLRLLASFIGPKRAEVALHRRFDHLRASGEWFRPADDLLKFIRGEGWVTTDLDALPPMVKLEPFPDNGKAGDRLRAAREKAGLSQGQAAARHVGSPSAQYWSDVERGRRMPSLEWLYEAARAIGCNPRSLDERLASRRWPKA